MFFNKDCVMDKNNLVKEMGHVLYFEPNDVYYGTDGDKNSVPLMPHFEDMCVAMTLIAEVYPRSGNFHKEDGSEKNNITTRSISWISYAGRKDEMSFNINRGVGMGSENYLTTYYTEISADKYIENEIIEGLGVTSVNIAYESWFAPTVTINFVDVHGSALWGREEAIHDDGITSGNVLGVFFTIPYPLFRLQIKGFLGHDVTYQLSVSSLKGNYNSSTGNFEATVTFIGYSYSLLTDIPLNLLSVIPEMSYVGKKYWDEHVDSPEWAMLNADGTKSKPRKLYELMNDIRSAVGTLDAKEGKDCEGKETGTEGVTGEGVKDPTTENNVVPLSSASIYRNANEIKTWLELVLTNFNFVIDSLKEGYNHINETKNEKTQEEQIVLISSTDKVTVLANIVSAYTKFLQSLANYNEKALDVDKLSNPLKDTELDYIFQNNERYINFERIFVQGQNLFDSKPSISYINNRPPDKICGIKPNDETIKIFDEIVKGKKTKEIDNYYMSYVQSKFNYTSEGQYAYIIPLGTIRSDIAGIKSRIETAGANIETKAENEVARSSNSSEMISPKKSDEMDGNEMEIRNKKIIEMLGFEPTIGNFIKLLMCHLETFVEVMMRCGDNIYNSRKSRKASSLGLGSIKNTDIAHSGNTGKNVDGDDGEWIFPWTAIYNNRHKSNSETSVKEDGNVMGWPNDYKPSGESGIEWEEVKVVQSFLNALERYSEKTNVRKGGKKRTYSYIPMSGMDLCGGVSPFYKVGGYCKDTGSIAPYLGLRVAQAIGMCDNACDVDTAEAIGYMDALNLIEVCQDYNSLRNAITPKEVNQLFDGQVTGYLTCDERVKPTCESENGKSYNNFEITVFGSDKNRNAYGTQRNPMFVLSDNGTYRYSYAYKLGTDKSIVSIVPCEILPLDGNKNTYKDTFKTEEMDNITYFKPELTDTGKKTSVSQKWVYNCKSTDMFDKTPSDYTNDSMFCVVTDQESVDRIVKQVDGIIEGSVKYKDYAVKGSKDDRFVEMFMNRRYDFSNDRYFRLICPDEKKHRMLIPSMEGCETEYAKKHMTGTAYNEIDGNTVRYDSQWADKNENMCGKLCLRVGKPGVTFFSGYGEIRINDVIVGEIPIMVNNETGSLFSSRLYYQQNKKDNKYIIQSKAYLLLSSMMNGIEPDEDIFGGKDHCVIKTLPPFYVYFIGAMIWRAGLDEEPIDFGNFVKPSKNESMISKNGKMMSVRTQTDGQTETGIEYYSLGDYYLGYDEIDVAVRNKLVNMFNEFANSNEFRTITECCELVTNDNKQITQDKWDEIRKSWSDSSFDGKKPEKWSSIFGNNFTGNHSSVAITSPQKDTLRLLISEHSKAMEPLRSLAGLTRKFIVGRSTSKKVGMDAGEVSVSKGQMNAYLKGFMNRIDDACKQSSSAEKEESGISLSEVGRDHAIQLYYSLKHLWDTWLMAAGRHQFTVNNFFNTSFVFMDSFYVNTYNSIKLNAEEILSSYSVEDKNLLSFMSDITSSVGCMFFSLPAFLDSNVQGTVGKYRNEMSWKKENLQKMFTPIPYNEMSVPQMNNTFVFIYTHPFSNNALENTEVGFDSYDISNIEQHPVQLKGDVITTKDNLETQEKSLSVMDVRPNNSIPDGEDLLVSSRYGYMMPSFGVTVNRGSNHIFKGINVSMDSPNVTFASAQAWSDIMNKYGGDSSKRVTFHGQDLFAIYSKYCYPCEIEMMGCVQIQPLMYFNLLNIPMWRGTYMIYKVTHSMQPGQMTTKFTGMKMSKYQAPYATGYFTEGKRSSILKNKK